MRSCKLNNTPHLRQTSDKCFLSCHWEGSGGQGGHSTQAEPLYFQIFTSAGFRNDKYERYIHKSSF